MGFLLGLLIGIILGPIILAIIARPLSEWFLKRKAKGFIKDVSDNIGSKMNKLDKVIPEDYDNGEENSKKIEEAREGK